VLPELGPNRMRRCSCEQALDRLATDELKSSDRDAATSVE